jgi:hypothetical protein
MPRVIVQRILSEYYHIRVLLILILGLILLCICFAMSVRGLLLMENRALGWSVLFGVLALSFIVSFLYCSGSFLKSKRKRFDSARPMIRSTGKIGQYCGATTPFTPTITGSKCCIRLWICWIFSSSGKQGRDMMIEEISYFFMDVHSWNDIQATSLDCW